MHVPNLANSYSSRIIPFLTSKFTEPTVSRIPRGYHQYIVNDWLALKGVENFLGWLTGATLILYALGLPVYVYGKHMRAFAASSSVIGWACQ